MMLKHWKVSLAKIVLKFSNSTGSELEDYNGPYETHLKLLSAGILIISK